MESALVGEVVSGTGGLLIVIISIIIIDIIIIDIIIVILIVGPVLSRCHHKKAQHTREPIVLSLT